MVSSRVHMAMSSAVLVASAGELLVSGMVPLEGPDDMIANKFFLPIDQN